MQGRYPTLIGTKQRPLTGRTFMKDYALSLKAGTTPVVVRLRVIFLSLLALSVAVSAAVQFFPVEQAIASALWIFRTILWLICGLLGPFIAWKDPAMSMKMLGGMFFIMMAFEIFDYIRAHAI